MCSTLVRIVAGVMVVWLLAPRIGWAQPQPTTQRPLADAYSESIRRGLEEYAVGHWTEARAFFANAHALQPSARTLRGLALASYELRAYVEAIDAFEQALVDERLPLDPRMREECQRFLAQAQQFVSQAHIELEPRQTRLEVDGKGVTLRRGDMLWLNPGPHEIVAHAPGYEPATHMVRADGGEPLTLRVLLRTTAQAEAEVAQEATQHGRPLGEVFDAAPRHTAATTQPRPSTTWLPWLAIGTAAAVTVTGGVFLGLATSYKSQAEHPDASASWGDVQHAYRRGHTYYPVGFTLLGVGVAGAAVGCAWKLWPGRERESAAELRASAGGLTVSGRL